MDKPNIIHSFYSLKCYDDNLFFQSCYFMLSCLYVKNIGGNISIHTDDKFASLIESCPYDNIYIDLNDCCEAPRKFFAYPKLISLSKEPLGTIHIDGDVFLKKEGLFDMLDIKEYDCITQSLELREFIDWEGIWDASSEHFKYVEYPYYMQRFCNKMYNCGVIGFNNEKLFNEWYENYFRMLDEYIYHPNDVDNGIPDIIIEQQSLVDLCDYKKYNVKTLLPIGNFMELNIAANEIGYQHAVGHTKSENIIMCLQNIKRISPKHYEIVKQNWGGRYPLFFKYIE